MLTVLEDVLSHFGHGFTDGGVVVQELAMTLAVPIGQSR